MTPRSKKESSVHDSNHPAEVELPMPSASPARDVGTDKAFAVLVVLLALVNSVPWILALAFLFGGFLTELTLVQWAQWAGALFVVQSVLLAIWFALGVSRFSDRLFCLLASYGLLRLTAFLGVGALEKFSFPGAIDVANKLFVEMLFLFGLSAVLAYFRHVRGWRIVSRAWPGSVHAARPFRFSLRQLFIGTTLFAVVMAVTTYMQEPGIVQFTIFGLITAIVVMPTLALVLGQRRLRRSMLFDSLILAAFAALVIWVLGNTANRVLLTIVAGWYVALLVSLAWLRLRGVRLARGDLKKPAEKLPAASPIG